jgi:uncharacterized protein YjiK
MKTFLIALFALFIGCKSPESKNGQPVIVKLPPKTQDSVPAKASKQADFKYDLSKPDNSWRLPADLIEVSGNTWLAPDRFILIEDLHANLYVVKTGDKGTILEKTIPFANNDKDKFDIEDVTLVDNVVYALWSHGSLFKITDWDGNPQVKEIPTSLTKKNNTEGLCFDPVTKKLLIACKDESGLPDEKKSTKAVYLFDIATEKLDPKPFLVIKKSDFETLAGSKISFNPSAIAIHPVTHEIYLLSTRDNKCMAVYSRDGQLKSFQAIDKSLMPQPESICFSPEGTLYISSEGKKGEPGNLFEFKVK